VEEDSEESAAFDGVGGGTSMTSSSRRCAINGTSSVENASVPWPAVPAAEASSDCCGGCCGGGGEAGWRGSCVRDWIDPHLLELLLDVCVPVILDLVVRPPWQARRDFRAPVAELRVQIDHRFLLLFRQQPTLQVRTQVVGPSQPAALAAP
jgi:hypothetical protein